MSGRTPGRRGEKRQRPDQYDKDEERRRKAGKIVRPQAPAQVDQTEAGEEGSANDEDIFGTKGSTSIALSNKDQSEAKSRRPKIPQQVSDNKAVSGMCGLSECSL